MLSTEQFTKLYPRCKEPEEWVKLMSSLLPKYGINTKERIAAFISQCGHESAGWSVFEENLNYSEKALNLVFPKYFERAGRDASEYKRQPEKIANVVYANRMGNRGIDSADGWRFHGRGPIQLTGRANYKSFSDAMNVSAVDNPDIILSSKNVSLQSAIWFWNKHNLNSFADAGDIKGLTKRINGGYNGLDDRTEQYKKVISELSHNDVRDDVKYDAKYDDIDSSSFNTIRRGSIGDSVKYIQEILGVHADGVFGPGTESVVKIWQKSHGLTPDGIVGPKTLDKMLED